ncbi:leucine-rich repeat domain-containing protein hfw isoform X2 [Lycorma delicatula]|uniref:leucine-rich repeat domain-containing protein hfw isoform X2 n=1 Tax=Lycorma delicatula TaxID=130591 RepID=UPI003F5140D9
MLSRCDSTVLFTFILSIIVFVITSWGADVDSPQCVFFSVEQCPNITTTNVCRCHVVGVQSVICCHIRSDFELNEGLACAAVGQPNVTALHLRNVTLDKFDANSDRWRHLVSLSVTDSHVPRLVNVFGSRFELTCLNLSNNGLNEVDPRILTLLPKLSRLDLSHNNLTSLPELPEVSVHISHFFIDISDNPLLSCRSLSDMLSKYHDSKSENSVHFLNQKSTFCVHPSSFHWFDSIERVSFEKITEKAKVDKVCPRGDGYNCSCDPYRLEGSAGGVYTITIAVDCSSRNLTALPKSLPPFTVHLNVSYNSITQLDEISIDESYADIRYLYAEYNQIKTLTVLEGSRFMDKFTHLGLKHNNIKTLPVYILSHAVDRMSQYGDNSIISITLGKNRLHCDCTTSQVVKYWLISNQKVVTDFDEVMCENLDEKVIELDQNKSTRHCLTDRAQNMPITSILFHGLSSPGIHFLLLSIVSH